MRLVPHSCCFRTHTIREYKTPDVEVLINLLKRDTQLSRNVLHQKSGAQQEMEKAQRIVWSANVLDTVLGPGSRHVHSTLDTSTKSYTRLVHVCVDWSKDTLKSSKQLRLQSVKSCNVNHI